MCIYIYIYIHIYITEYITESNVFNMLEIFSAENIVKEIF